MTMLKRVGTILDLIEAKGAEVSEALQLLRSLTRSSGRFR